MRALHGVIVDVVMSLLLQPCSLPFLRVTVFSITSTPSSLSGSSCHLCPAVCAFAFVGLTVCLPAALSKTAGIFYGKFWKVGKNN